MNAKSINVSVEVEAEDVEPVLSCLLSTILLHRCTGKYTYKTATTFTVGSLGIEDVLATSPNLCGYVRVNSSQLKSLVDNNCAHFRQMLCSAQRLPEMQGRFEVQFYRKEPAGFFGFGRQNRFPWEIWELHVVLCRRRASYMADQVLDKLSTIVSEVNSSPSFEPPDPTQTDVDLVFDTRFPDVQPYLFNMSQTLESASDVPTGPADGGRAARRRSLLTPNWSDRILKQRLV